MTQLEEEQEKDKEESEQSGHVPRVSSGLKAVEIKQDPPPMIIGERLNTQGSKRAKEYVLNDDFDHLIDLAREQVDDGAHCLDVCVATTERADEKEFMTKLVKRLSLEIDAPLVVDSTDPEVVESALEQIPGRSIINSINLEGDQSRFHSLAPLMKKYGTPAIAMCIGPNGMAKKPEEKLEVAKLLVEKGKEYGLKEEQFIFDVLTFTLGTGEKEFENAGINTLEGIKNVKKEFPNAFTTLGLSNISFGLRPAARRVINSVFLYHAVKGGLDTVIVNPKDVIPYDQISEKETKLAEDLIFNKNPDALSELISYFESEEGSSATQQKKKVEMDPSLSYGERCNFRIINRLKDGIENDVVNAIKEKMEKKPEVEETEEGRVKLKASKEETHDAAIRTLNDDLLPAMKVVGDKFGAGELILPFVLKSAECMKAAVAELENYLVKQEGQSKGKVVLGTVYGDVHDIGKNLVKTIFENNGYEVYDLGKQVPLQNFMDKIDEVKPDAVGLSALLVSTSKQMEHFVEHVRENDYDIPVLCGGAAINSDYIARIAKKGGIYEPGVFYCKTMFDGLKTMEKLVGDEKDQLVKEWREKMEKHEEKKPQKEDTEKPKHSGIEPVEPPTPPHINKVVRFEPKDIDLNEVWKHLDKTELFVLSWGIRGKGAKEADVDPEKLLEEWKQRVLENDLFEPRVVYGYFKCHNKDGNLVVDHPDGKEIAFEFPRSSREGNLCLTDYFGKDDIVEFQAVTVGDKVQDLIDKWNKEGKYTDAYYLHGIAVETAEALAAWLNERVRNELNLGEKGCVRYSWGYPSCPDVQQHKMVWELLEPEKSGMTLTEAGQIVPEQSTAAIIVHHPEAKYFAL